MNFKSKTERKCKEQVLVSRTGRKLRRKERMKDFRKQERTGMRRETNGRIMCHTNRTQMNENEKGKNKKK